MDQQPKSAIGGMDGPNLTHMFPVGRLVAVQNMVFRVVVASNANDLVLKFECYDRRNTWR